MTDNAGIFRPTVAVLSTFVADLEKRNAGSAVVEPTHAALDIVARLKAAQLRPTRQRMALARLLFGRGDRHASAENLHEEAMRSGFRVSLATIYNTLHQFKHAGLLRELAIDGQRSYFDTNTSNHNHFYIEERGQLIDIPGDAVRVDGLPTPPAGMRISHVDVVVRLVKA
jgi:Fur family transcriptional regulator, iron response regulator